MKKAILLLDGQPPHTGEILLFLYYIKQFSFIYVCINAIPLVMPVEKSIAIWQQIIQPYEKKAQIIAMIANFAEVALEDLPDIFKDCVILTTAQDIFVHLGSLNMPVQLIPNASGYHSIFIRVAYRQGRALDWLRFKAINMAKNDKEV